MQREPPRPPRPEQIRRPAGSFGWLDARLLHDRWLVGLGPEVPRRAPLQAAWALLSPPLSAAEVTRIWMILIVAVATAGNPSDCSIKPPSGSHIFGNTSILLRWCRARSIKCCRWLSGTVLRSRSTSALLPAIDMPKPAR